jgi:hypothetical protein
MATSAIKATVIKPKAFSEGQFLGAMLDVMQKAADAFEDDFGKTTKSWDHDVPFNKKVTRKPNQLEAETSTSDQYYIWANNGTEPHEIWAGAYTGKSDKTRLAFSSDFVPKTKPGIIDSGSGWVGKVDTFVPMVHHPGGEPRKFDEAIKKKREPWFYKEVNDGLKQAAKASGHSMT